MAISSKFFKVWTVFGWWYTSKTIKGTIFGITRIKLNVLSTVFFFKRHIYCPYQKWQHKEGSSLPFEFSDSIVVNRVATQTLNTGNIWEWMIKKSCSSLLFFQFRGIFLRRGNTAHKGATVPFFKGGKRRTFCCGGETPGIWALCVWK